MCMLGKAFVTESQMCHSYSSGMLYTGGTLGFSSWQVLKAFFVYCPIGFHSCLDHGALSHQQSVRLHSGIGVLVLAF